jgi:hypothetical protein
VLDRIVTKSARIGAIGLCVAPELVLVFEEAGRPDNACLTFCLASSCPEMGEILGNSEEIGGREGMTACKAQTGGAG